MKNQIQLFCQKLDGKPDELEKKYLGLLSEMEVQTYGSLPDSPRKTEYLVTRGFLRQVLASYLDVAPQEVMFKTNPFGKPQLLVPISSHVEFNVSHCEDMVICAVGESCDLGIDLEKVADQSDLDGVMAHHFSDDEIKSVGRYQGNDKLKKFYEHWTLKEAYIKALGMGHSFPVRDVSFFINEDASVDMSSRTGEEHTAQWHFALLKLKDAYQVAVAVRNHQGEHFDILIRF